MSVHDRWHLARPPKGAARCGKHRLAPSAEHGTGKRWQVTGTDDQGRSYKRNYETQEEAKQADAELKTSVAAGTFIDERAGKVTLREYGEQWRKTQTHDHPTAERIERNLRNHVYEGDGRVKTPTGRIAIGGYPMLVLSKRTSLIRSWIADLRLHPNSARLLFDTVSAIFDAAVDDRIIARNPFKAKSVDKPKPVRSDVVAWTAEQIQATADALPVRLRAMAYLGGVTGMRQGELFGVALSDLDFLRRTVHAEVQVSYVGGRLVFKPLKNDKTRDVPVAAQVIPVLSEHVRRFPPVEVTLPWSEKGSRMDGKPVTRNLVFTHIGGTAYHRELANRPWRRAWKSAGIPDLGRANGMHVLRHSAASRWLSKGLNIARVAAYLGDTVAVVVSTYSHFMPDDDQRGRAIMDDFLTPGAGHPEAPDLPDFSLGAV